MIDRVMRLPEVISRTGLSKATIYRGMADGSFPQCGKLTRRAVGWSEQAIEAWCKARGVGVSAGVPAEAA